MVQAAWLELPGVRMWWSRPFGVRVWWSRLLGWSCLVSGCGGPVWPHTSSNGLYWVLVDPIQTVLAYIWCYLSHTNSIGPYWVLFDPMQAVLANIGCYLIYTNGIGPYWVLIGPIEQYIQRGTIICIGTGWIQGPKKGSVFPSIHLQMPQATCHATFQPPKKHPPSQAHKWSRQNKAR